MADADPAPLGRKEAKARTRQRLLDAALTAIHEEGEAGLTSAGLTRRAGIAQPSFYVHFKDVNDLLNALVAQLSEETARAGHAGRLRATERPDDSELMRDMFRAPLLSLLSNPRLLRLALRSEHDWATSLGDWSRDLSAADRQALVADMISVGYCADSPGDRSRLEQYAEGMQALVKTFALGHIEGRYSDVEQTVEVLMSFADMRFSLPRRPENG